MNSTSLFRFTSVSLFSIFMVACGSGADTKSIGSAQSQGVITSSQDGTYRLQPLDDIDNAKYDGSDTELTASMHQSAFLKFDLKDFQEIDQALLEIYVEDSAGLSPKGVALSVTDDSWDESSNDLPKVGYNEEMIGESTATSEGKYLVIDISSFIKEELKNDGVATVAFKTNHNKWLAFGSRESDTPPELRVKGSLGGSTPAQAASNNETNQTDTTSNTASNPSTAVNTKPVVKLNASPESGVAPATVSVNAGGSYDPDGEGITYAWNFGDGSTFTGYTTAHDYTNPGNYTITLTVTDASGASATTTKQIEVTAPPVVTPLTPPEPDQNPDPVNQAPVANMTASPESGTAPVTVSVNANGSDDPDGSIVSYDWSFGDGATHSGYSTTHNYTNAGNYTVRLTVTDNSGATSSTSTQISVANPVAPPVNQSPVASIKANPASGTAPVAVSVDADNSNDPDGSIVSYSWSFGDGTSASGYSASHTYNNAGNYTIGLTVTDNDGATASTSTQITVNAVVTPPPATGGSINPGADFTMQMPSGGALAGSKPRVFITSDIRDFNTSGEYDDKQAMVALMLFLDMVDLEGLHGKPEPIHRIIDAYAQDLSKLRSYSAAYPDANLLRSKVTAGQSKADGAALLIQAANKADSRPLWVLTWGGVEALDEAVRQQPSIKSKIRIISIGLGNTVGPKTAFTSLYSQRSSLWWILNQPTHRGIYRYKNTPSGNWSKTAFHGTYIKTHGALGNLYPKTDIRMGDFPSFMYLLRGNPNDPTSKHWGGRYQKVASGHGSSFAGGANTFWTDVLDTNEMLWSGDSYQNPWRQTINRGGERTVSKYMMQFLPELANRFDRAKFTKGTNSAEVDPFKYTN